jgi:protein SCO1/2
LRGDNFRLGPDGGHADDGRPALSGELPASFKWVWALVILVIAGLIGAAVWKKAAPRGQPPVLQPVKKELPILHTIGDFSLSDQTGRAVGMADFRGKVWIANFIFTRCAGICVYTTQSMSGLDKALVDRPELKLVSFSVDPRHDLPPVLLEHARERGITSPRWFFLTGELAEVHRLVKDSFHLPAKATPDKEDLITHSDLLALVDAKGRIRGYYSGVTPDKVDELARDARRLLDQGGE